MPDHDPVPDPMDRAYAQAEAALGDEAARAARRARVLAAVAAEPTAPPVAAQSPPHPAAWRRGGWLVAASVAGLAALLTFHTYSPARYRPQPAPPPQAAPTAEARDAAEPLDAAAGAPAAKPAAPATAAPPESMAAVAAPRPAPRAAEPPSAAPPPPPAPIVQAAEPSAEIAPAPGGSLSEVAVTAQRRESRVEDAARRQLAPRADFAGSPPLMASRAAKSSAPAPADGATRLHAAAAAGRADELADLLADGVPVDAPDADGETALMMSIQADQPAAAAVLRRHGASLERRNRAGESARDMAKAADDAELDRALGLDR